VVHYIVNMKTLTFYTDGGCRKNPGPAASSVYFPETGHGLGAFIGESRTNNEAEAEALLMALGYANANDVTHVNAKSDSQLLVNLVNERWKASAQNMQELLERFRECLPAFDSWSLTWVPRERNSEADWICNQVLDQAEKGEYLTCPTWFKIPSLRSSSMPSQ